MTDTSPENATGTLNEADSALLRGTALRLVRSLAVYGVANFGIRGLSFILVLFYAHYLYPSDYGIIYLAEIVASFLIIFGNLSIDSALQRLYFQYNSDRGTLRGYLGSSIRFGFCWMSSRT